MRCSVATSSRAASRSFAACITDSSTVSKSCHTTAARASLPAWHWREPGSGTSGAQSTPCVCCRECQDSAASLRNVCLLHGRQFLARGAATSDHLPACLARVVLCATVRAARLLSGHPAPAHLRSQPACVGRRAGEVHTIVHSRKWLKRCSPAGGGCAPGPAESGGAPALRPASSPRTGCPAAPPAAPAVQNATEHLRICHKSMKKTCHAHEAAPPAPPPPPAGRREKHSIAIFTCHFLPFTIVGAHHT